MLKNKNLIIICVCFIILVLGIFYASFKDKLVGEEYTFEDDVVETKEEKVVEEVKIIIHVAGEVNNPGIISLKQGSRIIDAIESAGGLTEDADISNVNLAYELEDAQKIYIPSIYDLEEIAVIQENNENILSSGVKKNSKVNINKANEGELQNLTGIGLSIAKRIVQYRNENGNFKNLEDIKNVSGIGDSKYENIKDEICIK